MEQLPSSVPEPGSRKRAVTVVVAIAAGVILIGGGLWVAYLVAASDEHDPEQAVRDYYAALEEADCDRLIDLFTEASWNPAGGRTSQEVVADCHDLALTPQQYEFEIDDVRLLSSDDNQAVVEVDRRLVANPRPLPTAEFELRREDGQWRIHSPALIQRALGSGVFPASHVPPPYQIRAT